MKLSFGRKNYNFDDLLAKLRPFREGKTPRGYNEKIRWLIVNDQMPEHVICSDKILCRSFVSNRIGNQYLRDVYQISESPDSIDFNQHPEKFVVKTNHDSGSTFVVTDLQAWKKAKRKIRKRMKRTYGLEKGEWAYSYIRPRVFSEEFMPGPIIDYKFHCCDGKIHWAQVIYDRSSGQPREVNVDENYCSFDVHFDDQFVLDKIPPEKPHSWNEMKDVARELSIGFRYVRVDLYEFRAKPSFGELTFWPRAGNYNSEGEQVLGKMLSFDLSFSRPTIHDYFNINSS